MIDALPFLYIFSVFFSRWGSERPKIGCFLDALRARVPQLAIFNLSPKMSHCYREVQIGGQVPYSPRREPYFQGPVCSIYQICDNW